MREHPFARASSALICLAAILTAGASARAALPDPAAVAAVEQPLATVHADQHALTTLVMHGQGADAFSQAFDIGDALFNNPFNALDGVGANVGDGQRFTRVPRADLTGPGEWASHVPARPTGPNAEGCNSCHRLPTNDGGGGAETNVIRDPFHTGNIGSFIQRNTPHVFASGAIQRLAEEMTEDLHGIRKAAARAACQSGLPVTLTLRSKGVDFGAITVTRTSVSPCDVAEDLSEVHGISADLAVRPFQWKGNTTTLRDFTRSAANNELGMQGIELVGAEDGDGDGVINELTVGDITSIVVYMAAQPRPTSEVEMAELGLIDPLPKADVESIGRGARLMGRTGCTSCHMALLPLDDAVFREPSANPLYRDAVLPAGQDPAAEGLLKGSPVSFDLTRDQPDNQITDKKGRVKFRLGSLRTDRGGRAIVDLFGDLKRHDMGPGLAERIDETGTGASVFLTENLWGVGSTPPYMHDGRATTITEAILEHGGEGQAARDAFVALSVDEKKDLVRFLKNLVLFVAE